MKNIIALVCMFITAFMVSGCTKQPNGPTVVRNVEVQYIKVPMTVDIPDIDCDFSGAGLEPSVKLLNCVVLQKRVLDSIREYNDNAKEEYNRIISNIK